MKTRTKADKILVMPDDMEEPQELEMTEYRSPTAEELTKIAQYSPSKYGALEPDDFAVASILVADNLLNRSLGKWDVRGLNALAKMIIGKPVMLDHDWDNTRKVIGRVFDASVVNATNQATIQSAINQADNKRWNQAIYDKEGYIVLVAECYFSAEDEGDGVAEKIKIGLLDTVSLGGFRFYFDQIKCPICEVPFSDPTCPHFAPLPELMYWLPDDVDPEQIAPYYIRPKPFDLAEVSFTCFPNLPSTGVISGAKQLF